MEHPPPTIPDHSHRIRPATIGAATNTRKARTGRSSQPVSGEHLYLGRRSRVTRRDPLGIGVHVFMRELSSRSAIAITSRSTSIGPKNSGTASCGRGPAWCQSRPSNLIASPHSAQVARTTYSRPVTTASLAEAPCGDAATGPRLPPGQPRAHSRVGPPSRSPLNPMRNVSARGDAWAGTDTARRTRHGSTNGFTDRLFLRAPRHLALVLRMGVFHDHLLFEPRP